MKKIHKGLLDIEKYDIEKLHENIQEHDNLIYQKLQKMTQNHSSNKNINYQIFASGLIEMINEWILNLNYEWNIFEYYPKTIKFLVEFVKKYPHLKYDSFNPTIKTKTREIQNSEIFNSLEEEYKKIVEQIEQFYTINDIVGINKSIERIIEWNENEKWLIKSTHELLLKKGKHNTEGWLLEPIMVLVIAEKLRDDFMKKFFQKQEKTIEIQEKVKDIVENLFYKVSEKLDERTTSNIDTKNLTKIISERIDILLENIRDYKIDEIDSENIKTDYIQEFKKLLNENLYTWNFGDKKQKWELQKIIKNLQKSKSETEKEMWDFLKWLWENQKTEDKKYEITQI